MSTPPSGPAPAAGRPHVVADSCGGRARPSISVGQVDNYLRFPHLHEDLVTFVAADDVWIAPVDGGRAWRLTHDSVPVAHPRFSPDGAHVAFVSHRDGHPEAYAVPVAEGGAPQRLTWWGAKNTRVLGWDGPDRVLVASHAGQPNLRHLVVRSVGLDGSVQTPPWGPAWGVAVREDGVVALSTPGGRAPAHWKRYRGGTAPRLWLGRPGAGEGRGWTRLLREDTAGLVDPMWVDGRLLLVSDRAAVFPGTAEEADRQADLWAFAPGDVGPDSVPEQLTHQGPDLGYVRDASTDGSRVAWHSRGRLWVLDRLDASPRQVEVALPGAAATSYSLSPTDQLAAPRPDHGGDASLVSWHGAVYWLAHREGPARALVADDSVRAREPRFLGRTGRAVVVTDADGDDRLEVHDSRAARVTARRWSRRGSSGASCTWSATPPASGWRRSPTTAPSAWSTSAPRAAGRCGRWRGPGRARRSARPSPPTGATCCGRSRRPVRRRCTG